MILCESQISENSPYIVNPLQEVKLEDRTNELSEFDNLSQPVWCSLLLPETQDNTSTYLIVYYQSV